VKEGASSEWAEPVMAIGCIAAVLWGIGVSLRAFFLGPLAIDWTVWAVQLVAGIIVCLLVARAGVWLADRSNRSRSRLAGVQVEGARP
jgi:hypothetical protein